MSAQPQKLGVTPSASGSAQELKRTAADWQSALVLLSAAKMDDQEKIKKLSAMISGLNAARKRALFLYQGREENGNNLLMLAIRSTKEQLVTGILSLISKLREEQVLSEQDKKQILEAIDSIAGYTSLAIAAGMGNKAAVIALLDFGVDVNQYINKTTALIAAVQLGQASVVQLLLDRGAKTHFLDKVNRPIFCSIAASDKNAAIVEILAKTDADINAVDKESGVTALMLATTAKQTLMIQNLLNNKADPKFQDHTGNTALTCAITQGFQEGIKLLAIKSTINLQDKSGNSPLLVAVNYEQPTIVSELLSLGADPNITNIEGMNPLHLAAAKGDLASCKMLVKVIKDINAKTEDGKTALINATQKLKFDVVELLLKSGANPRNCDLQGANSLVLAIKDTTPNINRFKIIKLFLEHDPSLVTQIPLKYFSKTGFEYAAKLVNSIAVSQTNKAALMDFLVANPSHLKAIFANPNYSFEVQFNPFEQAVIEFFKNKDKLSLNIIYQILHAHQRHDKTGFKNYLQGNIGVFMWFVCIKIGEPELVKALVQMGADTQATDEQGVSALPMVIRLENHYHKSDPARAEKFRKILEYLFKQNQPFPTSWELNKWSDNLIAGYAMCNSNPQVLRLLLQWGAPLIPETISFNWNSVDVALPTNTDKTVTFVTLDFKEKISILLSTYITAMANQKVSILQPTMENTREYVNEVMEFERNIIAPVLLPEAIALAEYIAENCVDESTEFQQNFFLRMRTIFLNLQVGDQSHLLVINKPILETVLKSITEVLKVATNKASIHRKIETILLEHSFDTIQSKKIEESRILFQFHHDLVLLAKQKLRAFKEKSEGLINESHNFLKAIQAKNELFVKDDSWFNTILSECAGLEQEITNATDEVLRNRPTKNISETYPNFQSHVHKEEFSKAREHIKTHEANLEAFIKKYSDQLKRIRVSLETLNTKVEQALVHNAKAAAKAKAPLSDRVKQEKIKAKHKGDKSKGKKKKENAKQEKPEVCSAAVNTKSKPKDSPHQTEGLSKKGDQTESKVNREGGETLEKSKTLASAAAVHSVLPGRLLDLSELVELTRDLEQQQKRERQEANRKFQNDVKSLYDTNDESQTEFARTFSSHSQALTLDDKAGGLAARIAAMEQSKETKKRLEINITTQDDKELESFMLLGTLAQHTESLLREHKGVLSIKVASDIRNRIIYCNELTINYTVQRLREANQEILDFLNAKRHGKISEDQSIIDFSNNPDKTGTQVQVSALKRLLEIQLPEVTPSYCQKRIKGGIKILEQCRALIQQSYEKCDPKVLQISMGFAIAIIGCFAAHLKRKAKQSKSVEKSIQIGLALKKMEAYCAEKNLGISLSQCIHIGKKFRHLNLLKTDKGFEVATTKWEQDIEDLRAKFRTTPIFLPGFEAQISCDSAAAIDKVPPVASPIPKAQQHESKSSERVRFI